jgi:putative membrane protein
MLINTKVPYKYIFNQIKYDVARVTVFSLIFQGAKSFFAQYLPPVPVQLPTVLGSFISLLLAFNINQSYDRWWEARKIWGAIVNDSRSWVIQLKAFIDEDKLHQTEAGSWLAKMAYRQIAWCYSLGQSLRDLDPIENLEQYLSPAELAYIKPQRNKPFALLSLHMDDLKTLLQQKAINSFQQVQLSSLVVRFSDSMGKAERIKSTVFPVTYRMFIHLFIYLFLVILSLSLVEEVGILEIPALTVIASIFFILEKTARYLQDPFKNKPTDTPVTAIARNIEINIKELLHDNDIPQPVAPQDYYLM